MSCQAGLKSCCFYRHWPSQVELYVPEEAHTAFGIVRAVVKDDSDADLGAASEVREERPFLPAL